MFLSLRIMGLVTGRFKRGEWTLVNAHRRLDVTEAPWFSWAACTAGKRWKNLIDIYPTFHAKLPFSTPVCIWQKDGDLELIRAPPDSKKGSLFKEVLTTSYCVSERGEKIVILPEHINWDGLASLWYRQLTVTLKHLLSRFLFVFKTKM